MLPTADLMPTGRPVASATSSTKSSIESTSWKTACRLGDAQSSPAGMPRISAISRSPSPPAASRRGRAWRPAQLDLDHPDRRDRHQVDQPRQVEAAPLVAAAEVRRTDLEDDVAALAVVRRQRALPGVLQAAGQRRALVERLDRVAGQRAEAHAGDVDDRAGAEGVRPTAGGARSPSPRAATSPPACAQRRGPESLKVRCLMIG